MKIEEFESINRSQGQNIKRVGDYYFCGQRNTSFPFPVYTAFPMNRIVSVDRRLTRALKWKFLISNVYLELPKKDIYEFMLTTDRYELDQFNGKLRANIRKSLRVFSFRKPSLEDLLSDGLAINQQTCERQSRTDENLTDYQKWAKYINSIHSNSGFTILGTYLEDKMVGYLIAYELEGKINLTEAFIDRNMASGISPMKGLLYVLINNLVKEHGTVTVSYGFHRFSRPTPLTSFKQNMHFQRFSFAKGFIVNPVLLLGLRISIFTMIKILKRKSFKQKWAKEFIRLYQGHRRVMEALKSGKEPDRRAETIQVSKAA